jgi:hypothetical protein
MILTNHHHTHFLASDLPKHTQQRDVAYTEMNPDAALVNIRTALLSRRRRRHRLLQLLQPPPLMHALPLLRSQWAPAKQTICFAPPIP